MKVRIRDIGEIYTGNTPSKKNILYWNSDDIGFVKPDIIADDAIIRINKEKCKEFISFCAIDKARIVPKNSVFVTCIGSIGKIGISKDRLAFNQQINAIVPNKNIDKEYLAYALYANKKKLQNIANAPVVPIINKTQFNDFELNIEFDTNKQYQITETLNIISTILGKMNKELELLDELVKARFVEMFGDPLFNPKSFPIRRIDEVAYLNKGITYSPEDVSNEGLIVLRSSNIKGNKFDLEDLVFIKKEVKLGKMVHENDILMCNRNGSARLVGKVAMIPKLNANMTFGTFMTIIRSELYIYLFNYFQTEAFRQQIRFQTSVSINQISLPLLASVKVPIPPIELQNQFANFVKEVDKSRFIIKSMIKEGLL